MFTCWLSILWTFLFILSVCGFPYIYNMTPLAVDTDQLSRLRIYVTIFFSLCAFTFLSCLRSFFRALWTAVVLPLSLFRYWCIFQFKLFFFLLPKVLLIFNAYFTLIFFIITLRCADFIFVAFGFRLSRNTDDSKRKYAN